MLVLSGRTNESVVIGDGITVKILGVKRGTVKLGFTAPREVPIDREAVRKRKATEATTQTVIDDETA